MTLNWQSTKFIQAMFVHITGAVALFMRIIDGGTYVALSALAQGIYSYAEVQDKRYQMRAQNNE